MHPSRAVHRVHIREARLQMLGAARDDAIIESVSRVMLQDLSKTPILTQRQVKRRLNAGLPASRTFRSLRIAAAATDLNEATGAV